MENKAIFGDRSVFAVQAETSDLGCRRVYGRIQFWINGESLGDWDDTVDLAACARWGRTFLQASPSRTRADLDDVDASEVYENLYGRFIQSVHAPSSGRSSGDWDRDPYLLDEVGDAALRDKFAVVVVRRSDKADRVIVKDFEREMVFERIVPHGVIDEVLEQFGKWALS